MEWAVLWVNLGVFVATGGAAAVAWWQAIEASRSREDAREAQKAALAAWQESSAALVRANEISGASLRGPYAHALNDLGTALLSARMAGASGTQVQRILFEKMSIIGERGFSAGDVPVDSIATWCSVYAREVDIGNPPDLDRVMDAMKLVYERVSMWLRDPEAADRLVREDPRIDVDFKF